MSNKDVTTGIGRISYPHLFQPEAAPGQTEHKYSVTLLIPKTDTATKAALDAAIQAAINDGVKGYTGPIILSKPVVRDGDGPRPNGQPYGPECKGMWVIKAKSKNKPQIVDGQIQPIIDPTQMYAGCYGRVAGYMRAYAMAGATGVSFILNAVQKTGDGEPLGTPAPTAEEMFGAPAATPQAPQTPAPAGYPSNVGWPTNSSPWG
ncbi:hypothetical protein B5E80_15310 [Flavonifractor sp. An135]|nr:DUF2815 family protein [Flavonifractor sp. An135]OUQ22165.1 hypothetical protein B5E80_15310 [Flavonifractor sp. An135]